MRHAKPAALCAGIALIATTVAATNFSSDATTVVTREIIAVYVGAEGTDGGMTSAVADMRSSLTTQATARGFRFIARGVSIEPTVQGGLRHLARLGAFDEVSVGGNWGNSAVVRYLGGDSRDTLQVIPQVVLVERDARVEGHKIEFGAERELARYIGTDVISAWVRRGAPIER
jgi:hypothetical protein